ncbi:MAG: cation:proton antiporter [bacterium]|nr:MAG: cation:proton antiporter [bacterium]
MNRIVVSAILVLLLMLFLTRIDFGGDGHVMAESMMALGFTLVVAYLAGKMIERFKLPKITGYLIAGILIGPYFLNLLSVEVVKNLQLIDNIALSLIALTAGGEFRFSAIKKQLRLINSAIFWQIIIVILLFTAFVLAYFKKISFLQNESFLVILGAGMLFGALSIAKSPATTIAVIAETRAKGPFTDFVLGVTVFKDVVVVIIFSIIIAFAKPMIMREEQIQLIYVLNVFIEIILSMIFGIAAGGIILLYLKYIKEQKVLFLLGFIIFCIEISHIFQLEVILIFMVAGIFVQNFSRAGQPLIEAIEEVSLPIFVTFFAIAGASLKLPVFLENWKLALYLVTLRLIGTYLGTNIAGRVNRSGDQIKKYGWMGFVGQAGLTLGLATLTLKQIPGPIGIGISTLIISSITLNQIIGPVLFKFSLHKSGEVRANN